MSLTILLNTLQFITHHPLNRQHKVEAIARFLRWQIGSRLVPGAVVYEWIQGARFLVHKGESGLTGNIYTGLYEFQEMAFLLHVLRPDDLFVDVGANLGSWTLLACGVVGARGIAFEPEPTAFARLVENVRLNRLENRVRCLNQAVGATAGQTSFVKEQGTSHHVLAPGETARQVVEVEMTTLDDALSAESPFLLKIDVEGYESAVVQGAIRTLQRPSLVVVVMETKGRGSRYRFHEAQILETMNALGFGRYAYDPFRRTLRPLQPEETPANNTLFIRDPALAQERVTHAPDVVVHGQRL